jgi:5'-nucleotidase
MRILVTNDDGINAPGLKVLEAIAAEIAGPKGEVWVVAPAFEQSGVAHKISYTHPMMIAKLGPRRYAAEGSPGRLRARRALRGAAGRGGPTSCCRA